MQLYNKLNHTFVSNATHSKYPISYEKLYTIYMCIFKITESVFLNEHCWNFVALHETNLVLSYLRFGKISLPAENLGRGFLIIVIFKD